MPTMARSEEDIQWELDEGIPQVEDPFIQKYMKGRDALIEQEHRQRHGWWKPLLELRYTVTNWTNTYL